MHAIVKYDFDCYNSISKDYFGYIKPDNRLLLLNFVLLIVLIVVKVDLNFKFFPDSLKITNNISISIFKAGSPL